MSSLVLARPAHAEFFVSQKSGCSIIAMILRNQCRESAPSHSTQQDNASQKVDANSTPAGSTSDVAPQSMPPLDITVEQQTVSIPALPAPLLASSRGAQNNTKLYASVAYSSEQVGNGQGEVARALVRPTADGWYLFGVAWYWWIVSGALLFIGIIGLRWAIDHRPAFAKLRAQ